MKKLMLTSGLLIFVLSSCNNQQKKDQSDNADTVYVNPSVTPAPIPEESDRTSVKINEDGIEIENESGDKTTNVTISKDSNKIEIERPK